MVGRLLPEIAQRIDITWYTHKNKNYEIVNTTERLDYHCEKMKNSGLIGFDTETTGVNICSLPWGSKGKDHCVGLCLSYETNQGIYIPLDHVEFKNMEYKQVVNKIFPILETRPLVTHNGLFDYKVMYDMGCKPNIIHDSMLLIFNIYSKVAKGSKALKNITRMLYGDETIEFEDIFEKSDDYTKFRYIDEEVCRVYACADADYTRQIVIDNYDFLDSRQRGAYMRDVSFIGMIAISEYHGKPVDVTALPECVDKCKKNIANLEDMLFNYVGWKITGDLKSRYRFKTTSNQELARVFFDVLGYEPVKLKHKDKYTVDKFVRKRLKQRNRPDIDEFMQTVYPNGLDNLLADDPEDESQKLVSFEEVKKKECIPAFILDSLKKQQKQLTAFFNKIEMESDMDSGVYYSGISMTNTETARLVDFLQTLDGGLKYLIAVPDRKKQYMYVFDFSQIEYRVMAALAEMKDLCNKLDNTHTDFHVECAAMIKHTKPELIDGKTRKMYKPVNFGIAYGMEAQGLLSSIFGVGLSEEEEKECLKKVEQMLTDWKTSMTDIMNMLNAYRDIACTPRPYNHITVTRSVENPSYIHTAEGRVRVFDLKDCSQQTLGKIRRMAGNTPIQSLARTIYLIAINDFYKELVQEGLTDIKVKNDKSPSGYSFTSKVTINGYVHDEIFGFVDNDVNPYYLYNLIRKCCMRKYKGHPYYYCGIAICNDWHEGKYGDYEAPVDFVDAFKSEEKIVEPREDWPKKISKDMTEWVNLDSIKYVESIAGEMLIQNKVLQVDDILNKWKDYYYKTKIKDFGFSVSKPFISKDIDKSDEDTKVINKLVGILCYYKYDSIRVIWNKYGMDKVITSSVVQPEKSLARRETDMFEKVVSYEVDNYDENYQDEFIYDSGDNTQESKGPEIDTTANVNLLQSFLFK